MNKRILSVLLAIIMVFTMIPMTVAATENSLMTLEQLREENGAISIEAYNLGHAFLVEPSLYAKEGKSVGDITVDFLESNGLTYSGSTSYFSGMEFDDTLAPNYPEYLEPYLGELEDSGDGDGMLAEFDYSMYAGWCFTVNDWWASWGASDSYPGQEITDYNTGELVELGDVIRWHFTVYGYGADCGYPSNVMAEFMGGNLFTQEDKSDLLFTLAAIKDYYGNLDVDNVYETALEVAADPLASADDIATQEVVLAEYIEDTFLSAGEQENPRVAQDVSASLNATMAQLADTVTEPAFGTNAGEWTVLCLARGEYFNTGDEYFEDYYDRIVEYVNSKAESINLNGALHKAKSTDNSRVIIALSSIGKDATSVGNWDLTAPYSDFSWIKKQGINGPIFALIALDTNDYKTEDTTIRQQCVDYILNSQFEDGGWALSGSTADPDVTAMALQALAPYASQSDVASAAEKAFATLSTIQNNEGGYASWGTVNVESCAQVIVACTAWGINPDTDSRFVKNNKSVVDAVLAHYLEDEAVFEHVIGSGANDMATDQACYALVAYKRLVTGKTSLYDMSDVTFEEVVTPVKGDLTATLSLPAEVEDTVGATFNGVISINQWDNNGAYKLIDYVMNIPSGVVVEDVVANNCLNGGEINWHVENSTRKLRVVYFDANNNNDITVTGTSFPADLFTVKFKVDTAKAGDVLDIALTGMSVKLNSDSSDPESMIVVKLENASGSVNVVQGVSFNAVCLYQGDDVDLIPSSKKAVALSVTAVDEQTKVTYNDGSNVIDFKYSPEISSKTGVSSYVAIVPASIDMQNFAYKANYEIADTLAESMQFGDANFDGVVNAQDALSAVDAWLRKSDAPNDSEILALNVNSDSRVNTFDALGIVESYVNGTDYQVVVRAAALAN